MKIYTNENILIYSIILGGPINEVLDFTPTFALNE